MRCPICLPLSGSSIRSRKPVRYSRNGLRYVSPARTITRRFTISEHVRAFDGSGFCTCSGCSTQNRAKSPWHQATHCRIESSPSPLSVRLYGAIVSSGSIHPRDADRTYQ